MRKTWLAIVMILILISSTGCQQNIGKKNLGDKFVVGQDDQPNILTGDSGLASSKEGTYIMDCGKLDYFDYKTQSIVPVCNKTECDHNDRMSCNAYCCGDANEIWYYDDSIYFVGSDYTKEMAEGLSLYRVKKDGTGKEKLYDLYLLSEDVAGEMSAVIDVAIHRGYVYYDEVDYDKEKKEDITRLCRKKLKKNAQKEVLNEIKGKNGSHAMIRGYGNNIYYSGLYKDSETGQYAEDLCRYDIISEETEKIVNFSNEGVDGNDISFMGYTVIAGDLYYKQNDEVIRRDGKTGEETVIFNIAKEKEEDKNTADEWWLYGDGTYLYLDNYNDLEKTQLNTIVVLNQEGEKLEKLEYGTSGSNFYGADDKYIYFELNGDNNIMSCYDKTQLGKGTFDTKPLLKEDPETGNIIECNEP